MDSYTRQEQYLNGILNGGDVPEPYTREEQLLYDIAKNGGGGGGGGASAVIVNFTTESDTLVADKTIAEIVTAYNGGSIVLAKCADSDLGAELLYQLNFAFSEGGSAACGFFSFFGDTESVFGDTESAPNVYIIFGTNDGEGDAWTYANPQTIPSAGQIQDGNTGYATGGDVYTALSSKQDKVLPSEYQQVEYIESTGTQYIDTGYVPTLTTRWELVCQAISGSSDNSIRNGRHGGGDGERFAMDFDGLIPSDTQSTANRVSPAIGSVSPIRLDYPTYAGGSLQIKPYVYEKTKSVLDASDLSYEFNDGIYKTTISATLTFNSNDSLYLMARHLTNGVDGCGTSRVFSHKIWENGAKVQDFIPCYRKSDNVIGMYDIIGKQFYTNAGTGAFLKGADV